LKLLLFTLSTYSCISRYLGFKIDYSWMCVYYVALINRSWSSFDFFNDDCNLSSLRSSMIGVSLNSYHIVFTSLSIDGELRRLRGYVVANTNDENLFVIVRWRGLANTFS
jgi:hypothetical protein